MMLRLDEVGEKYEVLKAKIISYVTNRVEQSRVGGAVPMDVDGVWEDTNGGPWGGQMSGTECGLCESWGEEGISAVYSGVRCHECQGVGHIARDCPRRGKGK